jgi:arylsulfatase A-like enzyme
VVSVGFALRGLAAVAATTLPAVLMACGDARPVARGPNVLWVVWDTVRADRMSLHGHARPTTPRLDAWAAGARVFDDAVSPAGYTMPSHASMFTGLLPGEHCAHNGQPRLEDRFTTLAELLRDAGYRTFLFSANPHVSAQPARNLAQGFERTEHPWSPRWGDEALRLVQAKLPAEDRSSELAERLAAAERGDRSLTPWNIKAAGALAQRAVLEWLASGDAQRPWFVFLNYMEAHRPLIPPRSYRELMMSEKDVGRSYEIDRSWLPLWEYTFGLREYTEAELELTRATYDAALRELDDLFAELLDALAERGFLRDTVVVLTSDHGEHLGEHHMLDHQYSLHQVLLRVPLLIHYPGRIEPGRDTRPVSTRDLFPTLLELAGVEAPAGAPAGTSLLAPREARSRLAEDPASSTVGIAQVLAAHPGWDPSPFRRRLRALLEDGHKYLWSSNGSHALYDLRSDPLEQRNLIGEAPERAQRLDAALAARHAALARCEPDTGASPPALSEEERRLLEGLGYVAPEAEPGGAPSP